MALIPLTGRGHVFGQLFDVLAPYSGKTGLQGILKKNANRKARASGLDMTDSILVLSAAVSTVADCSIAAQILPVLNREAITPREASLPIAEATKAINSCHGKPNRLVTGSIKVPTL